MKTPSSDFVLVELGVCSVGPCASEALDLPLSNIPRPTTVLVLKLTSRKGETMLRTRRRRRTTKKGV